MYHSAAMPLSTIADQALSLDRRSPLPLYAQIKQRLVAIILQWDRPQERFYSDEQLCAMFGVSRDTVRQAVAELVHDGVLTRSRGLGTFVSKKLEERFDPGMDLHGQWAASGTPMQTLPLVFQRRPADDAIARRLGLAPGDETLYVKRVRCAARVPIALDHRHLPGDLVRHWTPAMAEGSPLHVLWQDVDLDSGAFTIEAGRAGTDEVTHLHLEPDEPVLVRSLDYRDHAGRVVMSGHTIHRADLARYSLTVPLSRATHAQTPPPGGLHDD